MQRIKNLQNLAILINKQNVIWREKAIFEEKVNLLEEGIETVYYGISDT